MGKINLGHHKNGRPYKNNSLRFEFHESNYSLVVLKLKSSQKIIGYPMNFTRLKVEQKRGPVAYWSYFNRLKMMTEEEWEMFHLEDLLYD